MFKFEKLIFGDAGWGDEFLIATLMTLLVSIMSMGLGLCLAILTVWAKLIKNKITGFIANFYTTVIRGVPELLVIYLIFFGGNSLVMKIAKIFGYNGYIELNALTIATIAIAIINQRPLPSSQLVSKYQSTCSPFISSYIFLIPLVSQKTI